MTRWLDPLLLALSAALLTEVMYLFAPPNRRLRLYLILTMLSVLTGLHRWARYGDPWGAVYSAVGVGLGSLIGAYLRRRGASSDP